MPFNFNKFAAVRLEAFESMHELLATASEAGSSFKSFFERHHAALAESGYLTSDSRLFDPAALPASVAQELKGALANKGRHLKPTNRIGVATLHTLSLARCATALETELKAVSGFIQHATSEKGRAAITDPEAGIKIREAVNAGTELRDKYGALVEKLQASAWKLLHPELKNPVMRK